MRVGVQLGLKAGASPAIGFLILSLNAHQDVFEYELLGAPVGELGALLGRSEQLRYADVERLVRGLPRCPVRRLPAEGGRLQGRLGGARGYAAVSLLDRHPGPA